ncbi:MAG: fructose-bisphosphate aldolase class I [Planctomycetes bacterium]|nr:fructose-bisphosphate aldolase class I [Planctomycetota bacterium]
MDTSALHVVAETLVAAGKGILAADESTGTIAKRLAEVEVESTPDIRRAYRELLFSAPAIDAAISGVILYDETLRQSAADGTAFPRLLDRRGIIPGIKVDAGTVALAGFPGETITEGLDGLRRRLEEYRTLGARFAKWRAVLTVGGERPTAGAIAANAHALARYAALCQEAGLLPIVEPEVLMDGGHDLARHGEATAATLRAVFAHLREQRVALEAILLKANMVLPGSTSGQADDVDAVADATLSCLRREVPAAVPGIVFLSGGQSPEQATRHLDALNRRGPQPWPLSFSFGRALQEPVLTAWRGNRSNAPIAQQRLLERVRANRAARSGTWTR